MIFVALSTGLAVLVLATVIARRRPKLAKPAIFLTAIGVIGALMFAISMQATSPADHHNGNISWVSVAGFGLASFALVGLVVVALIGVIEKWGLPGKQGRPS